MDEGCKDRGMEWCGDRAILGNRPWRSGMRVWATAGPWGPRTPHPTPHPASPRRARRTRPGRRSRLQRSGRHGACSSPPQSSHCPSSSAPSSVSPGGTGGTGTARGWSQAPLPAPASPTGPNFFQLRCYIFQALGLSPRGTKSTAGVTPPIPWCPPREAPHGADVVSVTQTLPPTSPSCTSARAHGRCPAPWTRFGTRRCFSTGCCSMGTLGVSRMSLPLWWWRCSTRMEGYGTHGWGAPGGAGSTHAQAMPCRVLVISWGGACAPQMFGWMWGAGGPPGSSVTHCWAPGDPPGSCWLPLSCCTIPR